jgi:hypothetical protein
LKPSIGWVLLSKDALSRAETQLREDVTGVRDEIGFLLIHSGYANRFFPGTSVLHTRLRYVLFIPWMYQDLVGDGGHRSIAQRVSITETGLAGRLRDLDGTIGKRSYPEPTSQPPTFVYWTALGTWGFLRRRPDGTWPTKSQLHRAIERYGVASRLTDDDGHYLDDVPDIFIRTPPAPKEWHDHNSALSFRMTQEETAFVRRQLVGVQKPGDSDMPSLLSYLAENIKKLDINHASAPWGRPVLQFADAEDKQALQRSRSAAALSAVGRAVYAALVETIREDEDGLSTDRRHREHLPMVISRFQAVSRSLDHDALQADLPGLPAYLLDVVDATLDWLEKPENLLDLRDVYAKAEEIRKGRRSRLPRRFSAKERRAEWQPQEQTLAEPIQYRWPNITRLLKDLKGAG